MRAVAHGWKKPGGGGPSEKVAKEFAKADEGKHMMKKGGVSKKKMPAAPMAPQLPPALADASPAPPNAAGPMPGMKRGGHVGKETVKSEEGPVKKWGLKGEDKDAHGKKVAMKRGGHAKKHGYAKGGSVRGDGVAERGHTRGTFR
jgi:hypothetical protein